MAFGTRSRRAVLLAGLAVASVLPREALAQDDSTLSPSERAANQGNELFQKGRYADAIAAYMEASRLDPNGPGAPILVRNIAVLHEKLGEVDEALTYFRKYGQMNISADDRKKNLVDIRRLEGAKQELEDKEKARQAALLAQQHGQPPVTQQPPAHGRIDALTIAFAGGAAAALVTATVFGVKAEVDKPSSGFVTGGSGGSYEDSVNRTNRAHNDAVAADVFFGLGIGAAVTAVLLYALRTKDPAKPTPSSATTTVSATPLLGGAGVFVRAEF